MPRDAPAPPALPEADDDKAREALERLILDSRLRLLAITTRLSLGELSLSEWRMYMEQEIRLLHSAAVTLAYGTPQLPADAKARVTQAVSEQMVYVNAWSAALTPPTPYSPKVAEARAGLYAGAARRTYSRSLTRALGMPDLPFYPGQRTRCFTGCACHWMIVPVEGVGNWDCYWVRTAAESCPTCVARSRAAYPLRIRNGLILPYPVEGTMA